MSSPERRKQRETERDAQWQADAKERARKDNLEMYWRIEEADASADVKDILHRIATHAGLEW